MARRAASGRWPSTSSIRSGCANRRISPRKAASASGGSRPPGRRRFADGTARPPAPRPARGRTSPGGPASPSSSAVRLNRSRMRSAQTTPQRSRNQNQSRSRSVRAAGTAAGTPPRRPRRGGQRPRRPGPQVGPTRRRPVVARQPEVLQEEAQRQPGGRGAEPRRQVVRDAHDDQEPVEDRPGGVEVEEGQSPGPAHRATALPARGSGTPGPGWPSARPRPDRPGPVR